MSNATTPEEFKAQHLHGVWPAIPLPWRTTTRWTRGCSATSCSGTATAGCSGVYTTGTDGELSALDFDDFKVMVDAFAAAVVEAGIPAQVGCTWLHTKGVLERVQYAVDRGIRCVQIAPPFWTELNDLELTRFFATLSERFPDIGVVHYNIAKARFLHGRDYERILPEAPTLIGSKHTGGSVSEIIGCVTHAPSMHHFVVDGQAMPGAMLGAKGIYSFTANLNPRWSVAFWDACANGDVDGGDAAQAARVPLLRGLVGVVAARDRVAGPRKDRDAVRHRARDHAPGPRAVSRGHPEQVTALRSLLDGEFQELRYQP